MKLVLVGLVLITSLFAQADTDTVTTVLCRPILKIKRPPSVDTCYLQAKEKLKTDKKNPGNLERYLDIAKTDSKAFDPKCVAFFKEVSLETNKAGLKDDFLFLELSQEKGESRATLDEAFHFHNECVNLDKETKKAASTPADRPQQSTK